MKADPSPRGAKIVPGDPYKAMAALLVHRLSPEELVKLEGLLDGDAYGRLQGEIAKYACKLRPDLYGPGGK